MIRPACDSLQQELEHQVQMRTGRRIRWLVVEMQSGRVVLHGSAATYYLKQLAQQAVRDVLPATSLENEIMVETPVSSGS
jgi:osmotically-inducible protein OsmY